MNIRRAPTGHLMIPALVNGKDHGWFLLDTGAATLCISGDVAQSARMKPVGSTRAVGVAGSTKAGFRRARQLAIGPLVMDNPIFLQLDLSFLEPAFGVKIAGICGTEMFHRAIFEIDLAENELVIHETLEDDDLVWRPLSFLGRIPAMTATYEGDRTGLFRFDSGSAKVLEFDADTVEEFGLIEKRKVHETQVGGVGGSRSADEGELAWVEFAGHRTSAPLVTFSRSGPTAKRAPSTDGVFGLGIIPGMAIVFDYGDERYAVR